MFLPDILQLNSLSWVTQEPLLIDGHWNKFLLFRFKNQFFPDLILIKWNENHIFQDLVSKWKKVTHLILCFIAHLCPGYNWQLNFERITFHKRFFHLFVLILPTKLKSSYCYLGLRKLPNLSSGVWVMLTGTNWEELMLMWNRMDQMQNGSWKPTISKRSWSMGS